MSPNSPNVKRPVLNETNGVSLGITWPKSIGLVSWASSRAQWRLSGITSHSTHVLGSSASDFTSVRVGFLGSSCLWGFFFFFVFTAKESCFPYCPSTMIRRDMGRSLLKSLRSFKYVAAVKESNMANDQPETWINYGPVLVFKCYTQNNTRQLSLGCSSGFNDKCKVGQVFSMCSLCCQWHRILICDRCFDNTNLSSIWKMRGSQLCSFLCAIEVSGYFPF